jgi:DNA topoisomerase-1
MASPEFIDLSPSKDIITIQIKRPSREELETVEPMPNKENASEVKKAPKKKAAKKEKIEKAGNVELIITEKPQAAMKIAHALADDAPVMKRVGQVSYYEITHQGKKILVACAVGHLFTLKEKAKGKWPIFDLEWIPSYLKKGSEYTKKYYDVLASLSKKASVYTMACDYDIEGEVIGFNIMRYICNQSDARRMKFSALTKEDIVKAYENPMSSIDWGQAYAGETRHYLDWLYGINLSKALMEAIRMTGSFAILSIGRVQGPALLLIVKKEKEIMAFKSKPYWQISVLTNPGGFELKHPKDIFDKKELKEFERLDGKEGTAITEKKDENLTPPVPFDLTTLQLEAYRLFGITPAQILQITQQLYLAGMISYPRTSSQKLPATIGYEKILKKLPKELVKNIARKKPFEGKKSDPAHPAIYPTGEKGEISKEQFKIYDLIVRRFVSVFCNDALIETKKVEVVVQEKSFSSSGLKIKEKGWLNVYNARIEEKSIPDLNGKVVVDEVKIAEKETQPPHRYSPASIVSELSKRNLGTKSTRSLIIDILYKRGYISDKQIKATPLGISVVDSLEKNCPLILDEKLTRKFEKEMDAIQVSKKGKQEEDNILSEAKNVLTKISAQFKKNEAEIGKDLLESLKEKRVQDKESAKIMICQKCNKGSLVIKRNKQGRQFLACDAYPECKTTFSLPPYGLIKKADKNCEKCGWPILMTIRKGKRPWLFCFNPNCQSRQTAAKEEKEESGEDSSEK